jgi:hypothetical protein
MDDDDDDSDDSDDLVGNAKKQTAGKAASAQPAAPLRDASEVKGVLRSTQGKPDAPAETTAPARRKTVNFMDNLDEDDDDDDDDDILTKKPPAKPIGSTAQAAPKSIPAAIPTGAPPRASDASENIRETVPDIRDSEINKPPDFDNPPPREQKKSIAELAKLINPAALGGGAAGTSANPLVRKREEEKKR